MIFAHDACAAVKGDFRPQLVYARDMDFAAATDLFSCTQTVVKPCMPCARLPRMRSGLPLRLAEALQESVDGVLAAHEVGHLGPDLLDGGLLDHPRFPAGKRG